MVSWLFDFAFEAPYGEERSGGTTCVSGLDCPEKLLASLHQR